MFLVLYLLLTVLLFLPPFEPAFKGRRIHEDYLSKKSTLPVKGFFVALVFCSHYLGYVKLSGGFLDVTFVKTIRWIGQLMVAMFFFYSGYGTLLSIRAKGMGYVKSFFKKRFLPLLLSFDFCVLLYLITGTLRGKEYGIQRIILSFTGWSSIGNSNWFVFDTLVLYILVIISFSFIDRIEIWESVICFTVSVFLLILLLSRVKEPWWYNTLLCYPFGMWYGWFREPLERVITKSYYWFFAGTLLVFLAFYKLQKLYRPLFCVYSVIFVFLIALFTMKIRCRSYVCSFLGRHVFSIYILQRLFFTSALRLTADPYAVFVIALTGTIPAAVLFDIAVDRVKRLAARETGSYSKP